MRQPRARVASGSGSLTLAPAPAPAMMPVRTQWWAPPCWRALTMTGVPRAVGGKRGIGRLLALCGGSISAAHRPSATAHRPCRLHRALPAAQLIEQCLERVRKCATSAKPKVALRLDGVRHAKDGVDQLRVASPALSLSNAASIEPRPRSSLEEVCEIV